MLSQMLYISSAVGPITTAVTGTILRSAQAHNAANGITGVLCQGQGIYLQVLEGERSKIESLYARILLDKRHRNLTLLQQTDITQRRYGKWAMAHIDLAQITNLGKPSKDARAVSNPIEQLPFAPYTATGEQVIAKMDQLIALGKVMTAPVI